MTPGRVFTLHLPAHVELRVRAIAKTPGIESAAVTMGFDVPAGTAVTLVEPTVTVKEGPSAPPLALKIEKIGRSRTIVNGQVSYSARPDEPLSGPGGYGIDVDLPHQNPTDLTVIPPPLIINGQRVEVEPIQFILKTRLHVTAVC
jgi:hypothetical protein